MFPDKPVRERLPCVTAIILAAGESRRMGEINKLLLPLGDKPVLSHVVQAVQGSQAADVIVVIGHEADSLRILLEPYDVRIVENHAYAEGMGTSIRAGVKVASNRSNGYMMCLSDLPLIRSDEYDALIRAFSEHYSRDQRVIIVPYHKGMRGNPVILSSYYRTQILEQEGEVGARKIVKQHARFVVRLEMETNHVISDMDTPDAYRMLLDSYSDQGGASG